MENSYSISDITDLFCEFLEAAIHCILYTREIYPTLIFERRRKYNIPVPFSRSVELNQYIIDVIGGLKVWFQKGFIDKILVVIHSKGIPVERFNFEVDILEKNGEKSMEEIQFGLRAFLLKINLNADLPPKPKDPSFSIVAHSKSKGYESITKSSEWILGTSESNSILQNPVIQPIKSFDGGLIKLQLSVEYNPNREKKQSEVEPTTSRDSILSKGSNQTENSVEQ